MFKDENENAFYIRNDPDYGVKQAVGDALQVAGTLTGDPTLKKVGKKASTRKPRPNQPPPVP